jgi:flavin reductase (DIM6/NTAB) family NADH-FMN oxidoreductase RutF
MDVVRWHMGTVMAVTPRSFIRGMRLLAAGVTVVTSRHGRRLAGLTATAVCSLSAEPPQLLVCLNRRTETHDVARDSGVFAVNALAAGQHRLAEIFAGAGDVYGDRRFEQSRWTTLTTGVPILEPCLAGFDCRLVEALPASTHTIFIGVVEAVSLHPELEPLVYAEGDYGLIAPLVAGQLGS